MFEFIRRHWIAYLVGAALAVLLGAGGAYLFGLKASTPKEVRLERISAEEENAAFIREMQGDDETPQGSSAE